MLTMVWALPGLAVVLTAGGAALAQESPQPDRQGTSEPRLVKIRGRVVDDETGEPIERFSLQHGQADARDPAGVAWMIFRQVHRDPGGEFRSYVDLGRGEGDRNRKDRLRVLADGYDPAPVGDPPFGPADVGKTIEVTIRLRRGRSLVGTVVDHAGRPSLGAKLFLIRGSGGHVRVVDDAIGQGGDPDPLDPSVTRAVADEQGRFRFTGVGDARRIGLSAPTLHYWTVPVPPPGEELAIRLPEPATLRIPFALDGDRHDAHVWMKLTLPENQERHASVTRNIEVTNGGEAVLRDVTPGEYTLWRSTVLPVGDRLVKTPLEMRTLDVEAGEAAVVSFAYEGAAPLSGAVSVLPPEAADLLYVAIEPLPRPVPDPERLYFPPTRYIDMVACGEGGRFRTAHLPPGDYVVHVAGYKGRPGFHPFGMIQDAPHITGSTPATVPPNGDPPEVQIMIEDR